MIIATAGTLSMAAGAFVSVKSEGEVVRGSIMRLRLMVEVLKEKLRERLQKMFLERGLEEKAGMVAETIASKKRPCSKPWPRRGMDISAKKGITLERRPSIRAPFTY
jgi:hypothetical protein